MAVTMLHHVSIVTRDLSRAIAFYRDVIGLAQINRPPLRTEGAWFEAGASQVHVIANTDATFRDGRPIDTADVHFALRVDDFEGMVNHLASHGFIETEDATLPRAMLVRRSPRAGFPQIFLLDPDGQTVEINAAPP